MTDSRRSGLSSACVDSATLAAFVDGTLGPADRAAVLAHLSTCPDCYEVVAEVALTNEELKAAGEPVPADDPESAQSKGSSRRWGVYAAAGGALALAATLLLFILPQRNTLAPLVSIVGSERLTVARPTGDFLYGPLRSPLRGSTDDGRFQLRAEVLRLAERAGQTGAAVDLHAAGVAHLLAGDVAASVRALESAVKLKPEDPAIRSDLGAAYMTRFLQSGDPSDGRAAIEAFDRALARTPSLKEAWFNKALVLEQMNQPDAAAAAWSKYLELRAEPGWREEAIRRRDALTGRSK
jgi:tetratricopeptide (TPR) repeat protein